MQIKDNYHLLISRLDQFIRKFYLNRLIKGILFSIALIIGLFIVFNLLEYEFYFSTGGRKLLFFSFLAVTLASLGYWVLYPLMQYFKLGKVISHEQAATVIGDHFGNVQDKLLNILQLKRQSGSAVQKELIEASIQQKSEKINLVPFKSAIDLRKNRQYLKYALPPFLLLIVFLFAAPSIITDSTYRILNNDKEFEKAAPFHFTIQQDELAVLQHKDFTIDVKVDGSVLPEEVFIDVDNFEYRLDKKSNSEYSYTFKNVQKPIDFAFYSGKVRSKDYDLDVLPIPNLLDFSLDLRYPSYTKRTNERIQNIGDVVVPAGTRILWNFSTKNTEALALTFNNKKVEATRKEENRYTYSKSQYSDQVYKVFISNEHLPVGDSVAYSINVIPDRHPAITVKNFQDSLENEVVYFVGQASDDYGISTLNFHYNVINESGLNVVSKSIPLSVKGELETPYDYLFDMSTLEINPGFKVQYYFEVFDNDAVNGKKSAKTSIMSFEKPTIEEFKELEDENEEDIKDNLEESLKEAKKIQEKLKKLREKLLNEKELDWQDKKELEKLIEEQKEVQKKLEEAKKKFDKNLENQEEFNPQSEQIQEKQEKMQEMFEELMSPEAEELMEKIQELMQELDKEEAIEMMEEFEMNEEMMEKNMERLEELFKQLEMEKEIQEKIEELEELAKEQEELSEKTEDEKESNEELKEEQEEINEKFDEIKEELEEMQEKNKELEVPKDMPEDAEEKMEDIEQDLNESKEQLDKKESKKASKSQKNAAQKMQDMAQSMKESMEAGQEEQMEEDMKAMRQLLENIVTLSFDQEALVNDFSRTNINTPKYTSLLQDQFKLKDDFVMVEDSLIALSKRVSQIETFVIEKVTEVKYNLKHSIENLEERQKPNASQNQRFAMKNLNDLALMLAESMNQMQQQMGAMMQGDQMCNNPNGKGKGKKGGKPKLGGVPKDKITQGQKELNEQMKKMGEKMGQGGEGGKTGEDGKPSAKEFAEAAAKQAALRKALEEMRQENGEQGKGVSEALQEIIDQMNQTEIDLVNKRLDNETLKRQQQIETRLLEAEKADQQRKFDNKRKGETAQELERKLPPSIEEYIKKREAEVEMYKTISPSLRPYYKKLVEDYYNALKAN